MRHATLLLVLLAIPLAAAQDDPGVNESDMDTTTPPPDETYLDEADAETQDEPTLSESDFDTTLPPGDESYLDDAEAEIADDTPATAKDAPGLGALAVVGTLALMAVFVKRD